MVCAESENSVANSLRELARFLETHPAVVEKACIQNAYQPALGVSGGVKLGDDCAAIPDPVGGGYLLFAAEGMLESFVSDDPWFAGYSAVMVNLSDIAAMGGRPIAITNTLWSHEGSVREEVWQGMRCASEAYGVPIVGGHSTQIANGASTHLGASVLGRAGDHLLTSFDAKPGDKLLIAIDMNGAYRKDKPFWNASTTTDPERLRTNLELLAQLAERKLCQAAKDISNGGIIGTLAMLCNCSEVGAVVDLNKMPCPEDTDWEKWLVSFPSYGYLLAVAEDSVGSVVELFEENCITAQVCGEFISEAGISVLLDGRIEKLDV
ncbi:sll0787 family AIR synthase-like protein [Puniceicoccaceae bacterium K14]|nr:sll0787 family AIR synthase-like protein [Puniceicoccaceae bacterium K14]